MPHIEIRPPGEQDGAFLDQQMRATELDLQYRIVQREERAAAAARKAGREDENREIELRRTGLKIMTELIEFLVNYVVSVDGIPVDPGNMEDRERAKTAVRYANKAQIDGMLAVVRGTDDSPK